MPHNKEQHDNNKDNKDNDQPPLATPTSFPAFPYPTPYAIQTQFMQQLFECIDQRKIGIFESPTGTGKSLSMICGAVSWLLEHDRVEQERAFVDQDADKELSTTGGSGIMTKKNNDDTPDWVQQHRAVSDATIERQERDRRRQELEERVQRIRDKEKKMRESIVRKQKRQATGAHSIGGYRPHAGQPVKKKKDQDSDDDELDDGAFLVDDYDSDDNQKGGRPSKSGGSEYGNVSKEVLELLKSFDAKEAAHNGWRSGSGLDDENQGPDVLKIYYCSRTHSQLSQFVDELRKTSYGEHLHVVSLGSRKSLCINDKFRKKASTKNPHSASGEPVVQVNKLNDACLDAQKSGTSSEHRCEFLHIPSSTFGSGASRIGGLDDEVGGLESWKRGSNSLEMSGDEKLLEFRDHTLARVRDIEELAQLGSELETCPYYGSRQTVRHCQLVTLPYNLLLHSSTRESLKLVIKDNILLLDEAHNLINSLLQMHSVMITLPQVMLAQDQLRMYLVRYESRLSSTNEGYIRVLMRILRCLVVFVDSWKAGPSSPGSATAATSNGEKRSFKPADRVMKVNEFLHAANMDHINLFKAHAYLETSGVARKLQGLHESLQRKEAKRLAKAEGRVGNSAAGRVKIHPSASHSNSSVVGSQTTNQGAQKSTSPILLVVDAFLMSLLNADNDGRIIVTIEDDGVEGGGSLDDGGSDGSGGQTGSLAGREKTQVPVLKFMLLNPANVFKPLVEEARSVVLAGGTMEPVSDLLSHLFPYLKDPSASSSLTNSLTERQYPRIHRFSCGHVIPKENLMAIVLEKSSVGSTLELNFANRNQDQVIDGIGQSLVNLLNVIPDGVVVFFVSYSYMAQVLARWQVKPPAAASGPGGVGGGGGRGVLASKSIMERIQLRKRVFVEPREATDADRMLKEYQDCIEFRPEHDLGQPTTAAGPRGAVLFSVVGGKMSEGINFSDRLGRGVIMVGMPFPNKGSPELQERMRYMDQVQQQELLLQSSSSITPARSSTSMTRMTAGSEYYENLCMRAVNQSIGRAIRHQGDYAVIILMDRRYGTPRIRKKLPGWIGSSLETCEQFGSVMGKLSGFFRQKKTAAFASASRQ
ncbi:DEAD H (Asp-Glu-Ala-Asp His) box helicase 11 [Mortierella hygrophila]|uniref:ATP-dependent DNA helicase CHL1 n=1 Tax=Mortierella hygrophila TaxID=979708 RepID=A0A9P6F297_9FUNG|nr:DEAD H (Asp-Glu-Ala-Asp His) box helicase 11 [Mortierella hygrophila]